MRTGVNPEKFKTRKNEQKVHRIIIPVFIPNTTETYFKESIEVFDQCLNSIFQTINLNCTSVTVVNNNCCREATDLINKYVLEGLIEKHVHYQENKGKVYGILEESRACFEEFITVCDADILLYSGWEAAVFAVFKNIRKAGVVSPLPSLNCALYATNSVFFDNYLIGRIGYDKLVTDDDCELFLKGLGNSSLLLRYNRKYSYKERHYYLKYKTPVLIGANHFVATYRREGLVFNRAFPSEKFKKGYEKYYIDEPTDYLGWYRLSTVRTYAYHIGNEMDDIARNIKFDQSKVIEEKYISQIKSPKKSFIPFNLKVFFFKSLKRIAKL